MVEVIRFYIDRQLDSRAVDDDDNDDDDDNKGEKKERLKAKVATDTTETFKD